MPNITNLTPPRVPLVDENGFITREWYRFLFNQFLLTGGGSSDTSITDLSVAPNESVQLLAQINELQKQLDALKLQVYPQLGSMAPLQQDNLPWVRFDTTPQSVPSGAAANGTLYWDDADNSKTLNLIMEDSGGVIQQIGEETYYRVKASSTITDGQVVMFDGTLGASGGLKAKPATGLTAFQNEYIMGVATQNIATNGWGYVTWFGKVKGINTTGSLYGETWADGDILYYNPAYAGGLTKNVPTAPNPKVIVASVVHAATNGILFVRPTFGSALGATDSNVQITSLTNGDILQYVSANTRWENKALSAAGVVTSFSAGTTGFTPNTPTTGAVILGGTLGIANGGTGYTTAENAFNALAPTTTRGDMIYRTASTNARLPVGTSGQILMSSGLDPLWGQISAGTGISINNTGSGGTITISNGMGGGAPVTKTANFSVAAGETWIINNKSGSSCVVTLPTASSNTGRMLSFVNYQAQTLVSASSNVVPLGGGAAGTAILDAVVGNWATMVSDGTNWIIMQDAPNNALLIE